MKKKLSLEERQELWEKWWSDFLAPILDEMKEEQSENALAGDQEHRDPEKSQVQD